MANSGPPKTEDALKVELNKAYEALYVVDPDTGAKRPKVCTVCDTFVKPCDYDTLELVKLNKHKDVLQSDDTNDLDDGIKQDYRVSLPLEFQQYQHVVDDILLSPRGSFLFDKQNNPSMSICKTCKRTINRGITPKFAISNGYFFGTPPQCLLELTPTELAWITPVNPHYGLAFVYYGESLRQLKGTLSYFKKKEEAVAVAVAKMQVLGLSEGGITVTLVGTVTKKQKSEVHRITKLRPEKVLKAVQWLIDHNEDWKGVNLNEIRRGLSTPIVVQDHSDAIINVDTNIETTSTFRVVFPDTSFNETHGGQRSASEFLRMALAEGSAKDVTVQSQFSEERVHDYVGRNLIKACILQYPYGRGGKTEVHFGHAPPDHAEYIAHLSRISQHHFHSQLHVLMLFNYMLKDRLVAKSSIQCRNKRTASVIAKDLTGPDLLKALQQKRDGKPVTCHAAKQLLYSIDAVATAAPNSNQAARIARNKVETLQLHLGAPAWFVTITPDDNFTYLLNIYSFQELDLDLSDWDRICSLTDEELKARAEKREELRLSVPGICAWNFENQLDAIIQYAIGWDSKKDRPTAANGYFGKCAGFALAVEEQGRKSLHTHCVVWIDNIAKAWQCIHEQEKKIHRKRKRDSKEQLCSAIDRVSSCKLIGDLARNDLEAVFGHSTADMTCKCTRSVRNFRHPKLIGKTKQDCLQRLRNLRHKKGQKFDGGTYLQCDHEECSRKWSAEEMIHGYLKNHIGISNLSTFPDNRVKRLKTTAMALIQNCSIDNKVATAAFEAGWNHHKHVCSSCFRSLKINEVCDCRYRYPKAPQAKTMIMDTGAETEWFLWNGKMEARPVYEPLQKRSKYDVFMNQNCPGIGRNKLILGNTNISLLVPGPIAMYTTKYVFKSTQREDSEEHRGVSKRVQATIAAIHERNLQRRALEQNGSLDPTERDELNKTAALAAVLRLGFNLSESNVIGPPLASYLLRNETRFKMSHTTKWISMDDIDSLLNGRDVRTFSIGYLGCPSNMAYDYICRPTELEEVNVRGFFTQYTHVKGDPTKTKEGMSFINMPGMKHLSWKENKNGTGRFRSCMVPLKEGKQIPLAQVSRNWLPDTETFGGSLLNGTINVFTEEYCRRALMLCIPFRQPADLRLCGKGTAALCASNTLNDSERQFANGLNKWGSYTDKFINCVQNSIIRTEDLEYLQNYQDCIYNAFKAPRLGDYLDRQTRPFSKNTVNIDLYDDDDEEEEMLQPETSIIDADDGLLKLLTGEMLVTDEDPGTVQHPPTSYSTVGTKKKVRTKLKPNEVSTMDPFELQEMATEDKNLPWIEISGASSQRTSSTGGPDPPTAQKKYNNILRIIVCEKDRLLRNTNYIVNKQVLPANGSAESIVDWSTKSRLDGYQRQAFEIIAATFVLTFFTEEHHGNISTNVQMFDEEKIKLRRLADFERRGRNGQVIALLHGPGGSGKSWVVDMVMQYAKEYTGHMNNFKFDKRTIIVTAMTGTAATLIRGETLHSALGFSKGPQFFNASTREEFSEARVAIVDEVSFGHEKLIRMADKHLQLLLDDPRTFGGISVIFTGDFRQLDPVGNPPLYTSPLFVDFINLFIEFKGKHRYKDDPAWGDFLSRYRDGTITLQELEEFNENIPQKATQQVPDNLKYGTYSNSDRDMINSCVFDKVLDDGGDCLVVFASSPKLQTGGKNTRYKFLKDPNVLWHNVTEGTNRTNGTERFDPVLKLYKGVCVLLTHNQDVENGLANGTQAYVTKVVLHPGQSTSEIQMEGSAGEFRPAKAVTASQIDYIELKHHNDQVANPYFTLRPKQFTFVADSITCHGHTIRHAKMQATQLPIVANMATTGHKLQGVTCKSIYAYTWVKGEASNWNYVLLSRVKTREGMYCRLPLPTDLRLYQVPQQLQQVLHTFRTTLAPTPSAQRHNFNSHE